MLWLLLPNIRNSRLNLPLSCVSIVLRRGGNWPLRACGDSCLLHSFSCERQQSYLFYKSLVELCAVQLLWGKEWEGPLWYFVVAIKLSLIAADTASINWNLPWLAVVTQPKKTPMPHRHTHTQTKLLIQNKSYWHFKSTIRHWQAIFRRGRKPVILTPWQRSLQTSISGLNLLEFKYFSNVHVLQKMLRYWDKCEISQLYCKIPFLEHTVL